ncbi:hypothetical protein [Chitinophaga vietnamensis]|uniref:hypothetical protein n=1 Tax=Chitinophaga vietnamensis TaxID=2593957 RepID=UPI001177F6F0|nr:hypothetical protein [Chitinophaga vietnamensis]
MRILATALLGATMLMGISCGKDNDNNDSRSRRFISFKLDNRIYLSENPKAVIYLPNLTDNDPTNDYPRMEITGQSYTGDVITFTLATDAMPFKPGAYPVTQKGNSMSVLLNGSFPQQLGSDPASGGFGINLTDVNNMTVEGNFSGTLYDKSGAGGPRAVTDGAFRAVVTQVSQ